MEMHRRERPINVLGLQDEETIDPPRGDIGVEITPEQEQEWLNQINAAINSLNMVIEEARNNRDTRTKESLRHS